MAGEYKVRFTKRAESDLDAILHYHLVTYSNDAARKIFALINARLADIENMPTAYSLYRPNNRAFKRSYRYAVANKSYRIIYTIVVQDSLLRVVTIQHMKADPARGVKILEEE